MHRIASYLPQDRIRALTQGQSLPDRVNGSAIYADISGFTQLTEKLTQTLGPHKGVDELSRRLNKVYGALIEPVERFGGSIISFAGDSIIGWFEEAGSSSALRAVTCAQAMQSAMKGFEGLSLKVSITSGPARRFAVGDPQIQFLDTMAGQTITRLAVGEKIANKEEIILDPATRLALQGNAAFHAERVDEASAESYVPLASLRNPALPLPTVSFNEKDIAVEALRPWLLPTLYEREFRDLATFLTELRPAVPMFIKFTGIDYDNDEEAGEKLNQFVIHTQRILSVNEGALLQLVIGDKGSYIYAAFGAPFAHEDDATRAVHTALEFKDIPHQLGFIESVHIGISTGTLRVGAYGGPTRRTYAALGDDVNLAARLMTNARPGEVLVTSRVHKELGNTFTTEPRAPIIVKGKGEPLPVFAITDVARQRATRLPEPVYRLPMIGRQSELALIQEKLDQAARGKGQVIGITAEAGMGKSRLVAEVIRVGRKLGFVGYGGASQSSGTTTPYLVWKNIWQAYFDIDPEMPQSRKQIRMLEGELEERAPERINALPLLGPLLDLSIPDNDFTLSLDPKDRKSTLEAVLEDCLKSAAKEAPLLFVLEDLHWVDPLSLSLLDTLVRISENLPVCFVLAYRPPDQMWFPSPQVESLPFYTRIELNNLTPQDAEQLIRAKLAQFFPERTGPLPKALAELITSRSQGNPFFIEELLNFLHDRGLNPFDQKALSSLELPSSLRTLILSRIDQLTEPQKVTLKVASIIGRIFLFTWLKGYYDGLGDEPALKDHLEHLAKLELTPLDTPEPELTYIFKHIVIQEVAYDTLSFNTRAQLHELLARYVESRYVNDPPVEVLAFHYNRTENLPKKREYLRKSGDAAFTVYANDSALEYYKQALALSPEREERVNILLATGDTFALIGKRIEAREHFESALQTAVEHDLHELALQCQLKRIETFENAQEAIVDLEHVLEKARALQNETAICDTLKDLSHRHWRSGSVEVAQQYALQSLDLARQIGDRKREALALFFLGTILSQNTGQYTESHKYFANSLAISRELNDVRRAASTLLNWGTIYYYEGNYETAEKYIIESLSAYREIGDKRTLAISQNNLGNIFFLKNDFQTAQGYYEQSLQLGQEIDDNYIKSISLTSLGITAFQQGALDDANRHYTEGMRIARILNHKSTIALLCCYQGLLALAQNNPAAARDCFKEGLKTAHEGEIKAYLIYNLIGFACLHLADKKPSVAVTLLSASSAEAKAIGFKLEPELQQPYDKALAAAKATLPQAEFNSAWEAGQALTTAQAIELATKG